MPCEKPASITPYKRHPFPYSLISVDQCFSLLPVWSVVFPWWWIVLRNSAVGAEGKQEWEGQGVSDEKQHLWRWTRERPQYSCNRHTGYRSQSAIVFEKRDQTKMPPSLPTCSSISRIYLDLDIRSLYCMYQGRSSLVAQTVKNLPAMQETRVRSLGWEDPLEKGVATHSSILAWRIPWTEEPGGLQSMGSQRVEHNWVTFTFMVLAIYFLKD